MTRDTNIKISNKTRGSAGRCFRNMLAFLLILVLVSVQAASAFAAETADNQSESSSVTGMRIGNATCGGFSLDIPPSYGSGTPPGPSDSDSIVPFESYDANAGTRPSSKYGNSRDKSITIMLTGDLMCQYRQQDAAYDGENFDFSPTFRYVKEVFHGADAVVGNLETLIAPSFPLGKDLYKLQARPFLNAPEEFLEALKDAGFTGFIMANNHNCDGGPQAITETLESVDRYGFKRTGLYKDESEKHYFIVEKNGIRVGFLGYATYFNKKDIFLTEEQRETMLSITTEEQIKADVAALREEGADYIIAYNHCGTEYSQVASARQIRYGKLLGDCGVDYVIGSHPHVLQNASKLKATNKIVPIMFSMGNLTSSVCGELSRETLIYSLTIAKDSDGNIYLANQDYLPVYMADTWGGEDHVLVPEGYEKTGFKWQQEILPEKFAHIREIVEKNGIKFGSGFAGK